MANLLIGTGWRDIHLQPESHGLFLVIVNISGRKYCFSTKGISVREQSDNSITVNHNWLQFIPALLNSPSFKIEVNPLEKRFSQTAFSFQVNGNYFPIRDFRKLGINFQSTIVDVYWYITDRGFSLKDCYHIIHSEISEWNFNEEENFVEFSVIDKQFEGDNIFPPGIINAETISTAPSESAGKRYPVVIGTAYKVPAYEISAGTMTRFLVLDDASGEFTASSVALVAYDGDNVVVIDSQGSATDGFGRKYNYIDFQVAVVESKEITVDILGHMPADLKSVIQFLFSSYSSYYDYYDGYSLNCISNEFSPITLSMVFNDDIGNGVIHVIRERLLQQFPLLMYQDEGKLKFQHLLWTRDVTKILSFDKNIYSMTSEVSETPRANVFNSYNMNYGTSGLRGDFLGSIQRNKINDAMCYFSDMRYGSSLAKNFDVPDVTDISGGLFILNWMIETFSKMRVMVSYHVSFDCANVKIWDTVRVYDKYQGWFHGPYFKVIGITYREEKGLIFDLISLDDYYDVYSVNLTDVNEVYVRSSVFGGYPIMSTASQTAINKVRVSFDQDMNATQLETEANYAISGTQTVTIANAVKITSKIVDLETAQNFGDGGIFTVVGKNGLVNMVGIPLNPNYKTKNFITTDYTKPRVFSANQVFGFKNKITVIFNESMMNDAALILKTNYAITGSSTPSVDTVTRDNATTVTLTLLSNLVDGVHTVTVINVIDIASNVIDSAHDDANFTADVSNPEVVDIVFNYHIKDEILLNFDEAMFNNADLILDGNYVLSEPGSTINVLNVTRMSATQVKLVLTGDLSVTGLTTVTVDPLVVDLMGLGINPAHDEGSLTLDFDPPEVAEIGLYSATSFFIRFNKAMLYDAELETEANYTFLVGGYSVITATRLNTTDVQLEVTTIADGDYTIQAVKVSDLNYNVISGSNSASIHIDRVQPQVTNVLPIDSTTIDVYFDETMDSATATDPDNYIVTGASTPVVSNSAFYIDRYRLTLATPLSDGNHTVTVSLVEDEYGNVVDPAHDDDSFDCDFTKPRITVAYGIPYADKTKIYIEFDEDMMDNGALIDDENYGITGASTPTILSVTKISLTKVRLNLDANLVNGNYTVSITNAVSNITDEAGNIIDPSYDDYLFNFDLQAPHVSAVAVEGGDYTYLRVTFDEAMLNEGYLTDQSNYVITVGMSCPTVQSVNRENATQVVIELFPDIVADDYRLTVSNARDLNQNTITGYFDFTIT
jgi:methionine-rich copper-binding protein CopC